VAALVSGLCTRTISLPYAGPPPFIVTARGFFECLARVVSNVAPPDVPAIA